MKRTFEDCFGDDDDDDDVDQLGTEEENWSAPVDDNEGLLETNEKVKSPKIRSLHQGGGIGKHALSLIIHSSEIV